MRAIKVSSFYSNDEKGINNITSEIGSLYTNKESKPSHLIGDTQQILIIFRDISVEKELQRERAMQ